MESKRRRSSNSSSTRIHDLPNECLSEILTRLGSPPLPLRHPNRPPSTPPHNPHPTTHPLQCALVCKHWATVSDSSILSLSLDLDNLLMSKSESESLPKRFPNLTSLSLAGKWNPCPPTGLSLLAPQLLSLSLPPHDTRSSHLSYLSLLSTCRNLRSLTATLGWISTVRSLPPLSESEERAWLDAVSKLASLTELRLTYWGTDFAALWERLASLPRLRDFHFRSRAFPLAAPGGRLLNSLRSLDWTQGPVDPLTDLSALTERGWWVSHETLGRLSRLTRLAVDHVSAIGLENRSLSEKLGQLSHLQVLTLTKCGFERLPEAVTSLLSLRALRVVQCRGLPESLSNLTNLRSLHVSGTMASLPDRIGRLVRLEKLKLVHCLCLERLPEALGNLSGLSELEMTNCPLRSMPESVGRWVSLRTCTLSLPRIKALPESLGGWEALERLEVECPRISILPDGICRLGNLQNLTLRRCRKLMSLPDRIGGLGNLTEIKLQSCDSLRCPPEGFGGLSSLRSLKVASCKNWHRCRDLGRIDKN